MPQLVLVVLAGAGVYAGLKWVAKALERHATAARGQAEGARAVKNLGTLEYDAEARVYRPRTPRGA